jgi:hypothetical protein
MLPRWLYESLPIAYVIIGVAVLVFESAGFVNGAIDPTVGFLSGLLCAVTGLMIMAMRDAYRAHARREHA